MKILLIHQNFPGQFKHLAPALVQRGHTVVALTMQKVPATEWQGIKLFPYTAARGTTPNVHPWVSDFETKVIRGEACFRAALRLKARGFTPDAVVAHPGWGESLFLKEVWPEARLGIYCEFYYHPQGADVGFDPEFPAKDPEGDACRLLLKNVNNLLHFETADAGLSPTRWQADTFPERFRNKITVVHDGIDTDLIKPNPGVGLSLRMGQGGEITLSRGDEVITFVNRNLEPYRGYHIFMRALPEILGRRPRARVLIVGGRCELRRTAGEGAIRKPHVETDILGRGGAEDIRAGPATGAFFGLDTLRPLCGPSSGLDGPRVLDLSLRSQLEPPRGDERRLRDSRE